jgi:hypothetical protein
MALLSTAWLLLSVEGDLKANGSPDEFLKMPAMFAAGQARHSAGKGHNDGVITGLSLALQPGVHGL